MSDSTVAVLAQDTADTQLPATYQAAQRALAECERVDECKNWADRAAALAAYARMAKNDNLRLLALRIQARAERRCGELLKQIQPAPGARTDLGTAPTRGDAADAAGLSERQRKTALRIANVPQAVFERAVESSSPPTITQLAERGTAARPIQPTPPIPPADPAEVSETHSALRAFVEFCGEHDAAGMAANSDPADAEPLRGYVAIIDAWLDRFVTNLPVSDGAAAA
jgi:hypothetical protein